jgi:thiol-disulfide isomerase/thioredoxin
MNEKKKMLILFGILTACILLVVLGSFCENSKSRKYLNEFYSAFNGSEKKIVMIGRDNCGWCQLFKPNLEAMAESYNFAFIYVNTNELTSSVLKRLLKDINVNYDEFGTPLTVVVKEGSVIDSLNGYTDEKELLEFLIKNDFAPADAKLAMNYVDYSGYKKLLKSDGTNIIVIGQSTCTYCIKAKPILNKIIKDKNVKINYLNLTELSETDSEKFKGSLKYLSENDWGTPLTLIIKNGEVIDSANGVRDYDGYIELFEKNGLIK